MVHCPEKHLRLYFHIWSLVITASVDIFGTANNRLVPVKNNGDMGSKNTALRSLQLSVSY